MSNNDDIENRFEHAAKNSHSIIDPKDAYSVADRAKLEKKIEMEEEEAAQLKQKQKPTQAAKSHGNQPSRGAQIDEQIEKEEHEELVRKGKI
ncbi:unnamed protein product [Calypogeia fissa]